MYNLLGLACGGVMIVYTVYYLTEVGCFLYFKYQTGQIKN